jgi:hypothetical protein
VSDAAFFCAIFGVAIIGLMAGGIIEAVRHPRALPAPPHDPLEPWQVEFDTARKVTEGYDYYEHEHRYKNEQVEGEVAVRLRRGSERMPLYVLKVADEGFDAELDDRLARAQERADKLNQAIGMTL